MKLKNPQLLREYLLAGNVTFTIYSKKLDKRYTYKIEKSNLEFYTHKVYVLYGEDNTSSYQYVAVLNGNQKDLCLAGATNPRCVQALQMLGIFLRVINGIYKWPETCEFYPSVKCARCGRALTTPESVQKCIGRKCQKAFEKQGIEWKMCLDKEVPMT